MIFVNARAIIERINDNKTEVIVQRRFKEGEEYKYEFPGGRIEKDESFFDALKREVKEETGLDVTYATGQDNYIKIEGTECFRPYSVYQMLEGVMPPVTGLMGVHFLCNAVGEALSEGDGSKEIEWIGLDKLKKLVETEGLFIRSDRGAALFYLKEKGICI